MLDKVRELLSTYKVHVMLVGGAVVVATAWGNCTFEPNAQSEATEATEATEVTPVSGDVTATTEATEATETTEPTGTITGTVEGAGTAETTETEVTE